MVNADGEVRGDFLNLSQDMISQFKVVTSLVKAMSAQVNREVGSRVPQHDNTMACSFIDSTRINGPTYTLKIS